MVCAIIPTFGCPQEKTMPLSLHRPYLKGLFTAMGELNWPGGGIVCIAPVAKEIVVDAHL